MPPRRRLCLAHVEPCGFHGGTKEQPDFNPVVPLRRLKEVIRLHVEICCYTEKLTYRLRPIAVLPMWLRLTIGFGAVPTCPVHNLSTRRPYVALRLSWASCQDRIYRSGLSPAVVRGGNAYGSSDPTRPVLRCRRSCPARGGDRRDACGGPGPRRWLPDRGRRRPRPPGPARSACPVLGWRCRPWRGARRP